MLAPLQRGIAAFSFGARLRRDSDAASRSNSPAPTFLSRFPRADMALGGNRSLLVPHPYEFVALLLALFCLFQPTGYGFPRTLNRSSTASNSSLNVSYSIPVLITSNGTYGGRWERIDMVPGVGITTNELVLLGNSYVTGRPL
jgi:hypothetical protein